MTDLTSIPPPKHLDETIKSPPVSQENFRLTPKERALRSSQGLPAPVLPTLPRTDYQRLSDLEAAVRLLDPNQASVDQRDLIASVALLREAVTRLTDVDSTQFKQLKQELADLRIEYRSANESFARQLTQFQRELAIAKQVPSVVRP